MNKEKLSFKAVIFDMDGVITQTAKVHAAAWKVMFDEFLLEHSKQNNLPFKEFSYQNDYLTYVDGKPRYEGVKSFLESRMINIPYGDVDDKDSEKTICGLGNRKNTKFMEVLNNDGIEEYPSTVRVMRELNDLGVLVGVASSSKNCEFVLKQAGLLDLIKTRVDGVVLQELGLNGKPSGDIFVQAAENLGVSPQDVIVVEDAVSGVQAGRNGCFGLVIGVARENNSEELRANGADVVIEDFKDITIEMINEWFNKK